MSSSWSASITSCPATRCRGCARCCHRAAVALLVDDDLPATERALIEDLLNDGVIPVLLTGCDPPPTALTCWLGTVCQEAAPAAPPGGATKTALQRHIGHVPG
jgi:hypothetical protein